MKILITGATGFIGRSLVKRLQGEGHRLICTVRATSKTNFLKSLGIEMITVDLLDAEAVDEVFASIRPDVVYHLAASVMSSDEKELFKVNIESTRNVSRGCYINNVDRLVYLSSVAVISGNVDSPLCDDMPYDATAAYGRSKIEAEKVVVEFREKGLKVAILRPCMVYGEDEPHALYQIFENISKRRIPILDVMGMDSRLHLVYVGNVADVLELALSRSEATNGTFLIADEEVITLRRFLEIVYDEMGLGYPPVIPSWVVKLLKIFPPVNKKMKRVFKDRVYDISRAKDILGYSPEVSTEEGLRQTVRYWMDNKDTKRDRSKKFDPASI